MKVGIDFSRHFFKSRLPVPTWVLKLYMSMFFRGEGKKESHYHPDPFLKGRGAKTVQKKSVASKCNDIMGWDCLDSFSSVSMR